MKDRATGHATDPVRPLLVPIVRAPSRAHDINDRLHPCRQTHSAEAFLHPLVEKGLELEN